jgi:membrane protein YdbS with pleckstrin-like domain
MQNFINNQVDIDTLPNWKHISYEKVSRKYLYVIVLNYAIAAFLFMLFAVFISMLNDISDDSTLFTVIAIAVLLIVIFCVLHLWSCANWGYALRDKDVLYRSGIFSKQVEIVPYRHIQHVNVKEGIFSRLFALVSIEVFTAGSGKSVRIPGISRTRCVGIQEFISNKISDKLID